MNVLRILKFTTKGNVKNAKIMCTGRALFPAFRNEPWTWVKSVHSTLDRLPGYHVVWWCLEEKEKEPKRMNSARAFSS